MFKKCKNNRGATAIEYGLISAGIAVIIMGSLMATGSNTKQTFCTIASAISRSVSDCSSSSSSSSVTPGTIDSQFISEQDGGTGKKNATLNNAYFNSYIGEALSNLNSSDPIVGIYGLYNSSGKPVETVSQYNHFLNNGTQNDYGTNKYNTMFQIKTQSGQVYDYQGEYQTNGSTKTYSSQLVNSSTGAISQSYTYTNYGSSASSTTTPYQ